MCMKRFRILESPIGPLVMAGHGDCLTNLALEAAANAPSERGSWTKDESAFAEVATQLFEYFAGERVGFDVALHLEGTEFQLRVWQALCGISYGQVRSYSQVAGTIGKPGAARAVGLASGKNPIAIIVPCHRVVGADGSLTGYAGGLQAKRALLDLEQVNERTGRGCLAGKSVCGDIWSSSPRACGGL